jgi:hypothetical protein
MGNIESGFDSRRGLPAWTPGVDCRREAGTGAGLGGAVKAMTQSFWELRLRPNRYE